MKKVDAAGWLYRASRVRDAKRNRTRSCSCRLGTGGARAGAIDRASGGGGGAAKVSVRDLIRVSGGVVCIACMWWTGGAARFGSAVASGRHLSRSV